jgi:hypothetical protein
MRRGRTVTFHGAFGSKAAAIRKERQLVGAFVQPRLIRGAQRYVVMSRRARPRPNARYRPATSSSGWDTYLLLGGIGYALYYLFLRPAPGPVV